jgi:hypothetical protein
MDSIEDILLSVQQDEAPPEGLPTPLAALWEAKACAGTVDAHWHRCHDLINDLHTPLACWIHAHLHRIECDPANAAYWYTRAGREPTTCPFHEEWHEMVTAALADQAP